MRASRRPGFLTHPRPEPGIGTHQLRARQKSVQRMKRNSPGIEHASVEASQFSKKFNGKLIE
jgi:hypothetical protein